MLDPHVTVDEDRIVVTFTVAPIGDGPHDCPGNDAVPFEVDLAAPIGERELVDGACLEGEAATTTPCADGEVRWTAP